jgi:hypothetical protein
MKVCVDLFAGLGGFSSAFEDHDEWQVFTVDLDPDDRFDPDLKADIFDLKPRGLLDEIVRETCGMDPAALGRQSGEEPAEVEEARAAGIEEFKTRLDKFVILASPPCTEFSIAASRYEKIDPVTGEPNTPQARKSVALVFHTIGLIEAIHPDYWFLENPRGYLRKYMGEPVGRVSYCQYGMDYKKPTDLWGKHPKSMKYKTCAPGDDCHASNTDIAHGGDGNMQTLPDYSNDPAERAKVPYDLSEAILTAVENPGGETTSASEVSW